MILFAAQAVGVFALIVCLDYAWARYNIATADKQPMRAAILAVAIYFLGGLSTISFVDNHIMLIPALLGAFVGTYIAVARDPRKPSS